MPQRDWHTELTALETSNLAPAAGGYLARAEALIEAL